MPIFSDTQWINDLTPDAPVIIWRSGPGRGERRVGKVVRLTATLVVAKVGGAERRFRRSDGRAPGERALWGHTEWLERPTPETLAAARSDTLRRRAIATLEATKWKDLPDDVLARVLAALTGTEATADGESNA